MKLFDLHCDTATRLLDEKQGLYDNGLHISINRASYLEKYVQLMAVWSNYRLSDGEAYGVFFKVVENLKKENREDYKGSRNALIEDGYEPCGQCDA